MKVIVKHMHNVVQTKPSSPNSALSFSTMQSLNTRKVFTIFAVALALLPAIAGASALEQFKSFVSSTQSAKGEFTQRLVTTDGGTNKPKVSTQSAGTFIFARPGKFIWTYTKPYEQVLQADGDKLYIYDKDLNQVTTKKLGNALGSSPAAILFGSNDLEKNFTLKEGKPKDGLADFGS